MHVCHRAPLKRGLPPAAVDFGRYTKHTHTVRAQCSFNNFISKIETRACFHITNEARRSTKIVISAQTPLTCKQYPLLYLQDSGKVLLAFRPSGYSYRRERDSCWICNLVVGPVWRPLADGCSRCRGVYFLFWTRCVDLKHQVCGRTCYPRTFKSTTIFKWLLYWHVDFYKFQSSVRNIQFYGFRSRLCPLKVQLIYKITIIFFCRKIWSS